MTKFILSQNDQKMAEYIKEELDYLQIQNVEDINYYNVYQTSDTIENIGQIIGPHELLDNLDKYDQAGNLRYRYLPGLYDEHEDKLNSLLEKFLNASSKVYHSAIVELKGISKDDFEKFKSYYINPVEKELLDFGILEYPNYESTGENLQIIQGFRNLDKDQLEELSKDYSLNLQDLILIQEYFASEDRDPSIFELKVIDTYWSDHCRHSTFNTCLNDIEFEGDYKDLLTKTYERYLGVRDEIYTDRVKPISLMDMATINAKKEKLSGRLDNVDESDEVNACCINIQLDIDGVDEDWLLYFKNETHNHPTEMEPFGGAATCVGGAIRDPLSGRAQVYQSMRITGAKNPKLPIEESHEDKLSQRSICKNAIEGSSDYANKYGLALGYLKEYYDDSYEAKRMEVGAMLAACPSDYVVRKNPEAKDLVVLLGGKTGRDGLGAAVGSSKVQDADTMDLQGSEVQKGNPTIQRKIQRLFNNPEATRLVKKCNDFGAGGVAVAIGELADGIEIYLDKVPQKYPGMDPYEIGLSESQERMAMVIGPEDIDKFIDLAEAEDLEASMVAQVNDSGYMTMTYDDKQVLSLSREFLDINGAARSQDVLVGSEDVSEVFSDERSVLDQVGDLRNANQKSMAAKYDSTVSKTSVLGLYGGKYRMTDQLGLASKIPTRGYTTTLSLMASGFNPDYFKKSTFHGAYYAIIESVAKLVAMGADRDEIRLSLQEYFPSPNEDPARWGLPAGAMLGAFKAMDELGLGAIGGKDSMSGSYEDMDIVPTLISFAVAPSKIENLNSRELKNTDSKILILGPKDEDMTNSHTIKEESIVEILDDLSGLINDKQVRSISTLDNKTVEQNLIEMSLGNMVGFEMNTDYLGQKTPMTFLIEVASDLDTDLDVVARTNATDLATIDKDYKLEDLKNISLSTLEEVYGRPVDYKAKDLNSTRKDKFKSTKKVLIPLFTGSFAEDDLYKSFKKYTDQVDFFVVKDETDLENSLDQLAKKLEDYDILAFSDGSIFANQPRPGVGLEQILAHKNIKNALENFVKRGYILGLGYSSLGLIRSGLIDSTRISQDTKIDIIPNYKGDHISEIVESKVLNKDYSDMDYYSTVISTDHMKLDLDRDYFKDQIVSEIEYGNENLVDLLVDPTGHVLVSMSNFERFDQDGMANIDIEQADIIEKLLKKAENQ